MIENQDKNDKVNLQGAGPRPPFRRPPPKPPFFGIRIHPVVVVILFLVLVAVGMLIAFASNPNFLPSYNPFSSIPSPLNGVKP